ncbi:MAG: TlpA family protein disulfide reductase [Cytophagales bacterium]|nr:MAG: TlpA family protein disulfide reductase [Cytophagales bacterium]TAF61111.1 MAG: TlpA family protein disulfide reductase [Cytophagales bacterium]
MFRFIIFCTFCLYFMGMLWGSVPLFGQTVLMGELKNAEQKDIYIVLHQQYFCYQPLIKVAELNENRFSQDLPITKPSLAYLHCGQQVLQIFLNPQDTLFLSADARDLLSTVRFAGRSNNDNNLLAIFNRDFLSQNSPSELAEQYKEATEKSFVEKTEQKRKEQMKFLTQFKKKNGISKTFEDYIITLINYTWANELLTFPAYKSYYENKTFKPEDLKYYDFLDKMVASDSSKLLCFEYAQFLKNYIYHLQDLDVKSLTATVYPSFYPKLYDLAQTKLKGSALEHTQAFLISEALKGGAATSVSALIDDFLSKASSNAYKSILKQHLAQLETLKSGQKAPQFALPDLKGEKKGLYSFKNKVVYITFWASWCEPCRDEILFANRLKKAAADDNLIMLYISLDENDAEWRASVQDLDVEGVHLHESGLYGTVARLFAIDGLPAYFIINKKGQLAASQAKRPSQKGLLEDLKLLLLE